MGNLARVKVFEDGNYIVEPLGFFSISKLIKSRNTIGNIIKLSSHDYKYNERKLPAPAKDVMLVRQYSKSECIKGKTFGLGRNGEILWVDKGCRGSFQVIPKSIADVSRENIVSYKPAPKPVVNVVQPSNKEPNWFNEEYVKNIISRFLPYTEVRAPQKQVQAQVQTVHKTNGFEFENILKNPLAIAGFIAVGYLFIRKK